MGHKYQALILSKGGLCYQRPMLKTGVPQTDPPVQRIDLANQQATRDCRLNKNMKLWIKTCSGSEEYYWISLFFFPRTQNPITDCNGAPVVNTIKAFHQPVPDLRSRRPVNREPSITANPTLNLPLLSFDVSQHHSWHAVSVAQHNVTFPMGKLTETRAYYHVIIEIIT